MAKPPSKVEALHRNIEAVASLIVTPQPPSTQAFAKKAPQVLEERSLQQDKRSPQPKAYQLNLLTQELPLEPTLHIEAVPSTLAVGREQRFWLVHQPSWLRVPGQFSLLEAEYILSATEGWNWDVDPKTREPACRYRLLWLLEGICKKSLALEVVV